MVVSRTLLLPNGLSALENISEKTLLSTNGISAGLIHSLDSSGIPQATKLQTTLSIPIAHEYSTHITLAHPE